MSGTSPSTSTAKKDGGAAEAQKRFDEEQEKGVRGEPVDPTPNDHYTVGGVIAGKPTPETDPAHAAEVRSKLDDRSANV